jgi:hypothetical protein
MNGVSRLSVFGMCQDPAVSSRPNSHPSDDIPYVKTVADFIEKNRAAIPIYEEIDRRGLIQAEDHDGKVVFRMRKFSDTSPTTLQLMSLFSEAGSLEVNQMWAISRMFAQGPKVYRPSASECEAMEQVELNLPVSEYGQPFDTMAIEFPPDYQTGRAVPMPGASPHSPVLAIIRHEKDLGMISVVMIFSSGLSITTSLLPGERTIEATLDGMAYEPGGPFLRYDVTETDADLSHRVIRLVVNAMMLLTHYGCEKKWGGNPDQMARLNRYLDLARKGKGKGNVAAAERDIRLVQQVYGFAQNVKLYDREVRSHHDSEPTGRTVGSHWRSGHWRNQLVGPGRAEVKRLLVRPCIVHPELLVGPLSATSVTYSKPGESPL